MRCEVVELDDLFWMLGGYERAPTREESEEVERLMEQKSEQNWGQALQPRRPAGSYAGAILCHDLAGPTDRAADGAGGDDRRNPLGSADIA